MLDLGVGQPLEREVRDVVANAARAFESAGADVIEVKSVMTREMLDGLDAFWRARSWDDLSTLTPEDRARALPYIYKWAEKAQALSGVDVIRGFNATMAIRAAAAKLFADVDYVLSPVSRGGQFRRRTGLAAERSGEALRAHRLYRAVEHGRKPGGIDQRRLRRQGFSRSACRSSAADSTMSAYSAWRRRSRRCAARNCRGRRRRRDNNSFVIPGHASWRGPGIHTPCCGYGFRARATHAPE